MPHGKIVFEDAENGEISVRVIFTDGEQKGSNAHRMMVQVLGFLDAHAESKTEEQTVSHELGLSPIISSGGTQILR